MGTGFEVFKALVQTVDEAERREGGNNKGSERWRKLLDIHESTLRQKVGQVLTSPTSVVLDVTELDFEVNPQTSNVWELVELANFTRKKILVELFEIGERLSGPAKLKIVKLGPFKGSRTHAQHYQEIDAELKKKQMRQASAQHFFAFAGKYRKVCQQVGIIYHQPDLHISVYGRHPSDLTIRWESSVGMFFTDNSPHCLVYSP